MYSVVRPRSVAFCAVLAATSMSCSQPQADATIFIDATVAKSISPYIYGASFPDWKNIKLKFPYARQGGNRMTAYNWETNASNAGNDYRHQNDAFMSESNEPGLCGKTFLADAQKHGAATLLTIPMAGYVAADKGPDNDVNRTPNYLAVRFNRSVAAKKSGFSYPPNLTDKIVYEDEYVHYLESQKQGSLPVWYALDNEPDIWASTHARIVKVPPTYSQILALTTEYATAFKAVAPKTMIFGPSSYGWMGYRTFQGAKDANGRDFLDFYLAGMRAAGAKSGQRLLDVLDLHYYPEARGDDVRVCEGEDKPGTPAARIQSTRSLWDPTYVETSWITKSNGGKPLNLIPDTMARIEAHYPGTKLAFGEYNWGGGKVISGAIAQADCLGIFGRYGVFAASHWIPAADNVATIAGFRAFLDYDGKGAKFGDLGLPVIGESAALNSVYAARDSRDASRLTLVVINKAPHAQATSIKVKGFKVGSAKAFAISSTSLATSKAATVKVVAGGATYDAPALSVTTIELHR